MTRSQSSVVVLTGAGISAESGLATFRDKDGLWEGHRVEDVACPTAFARDPETVHRFYNLRRRALQSVHPNDAHRALARLQRDFPGRFTLVTQNVDDLHERAGSTGVIHMHGQLRQARCEICGHATRWDDDLSTSTPCPACLLTGRMRPDIVWFGEMPYQMERIETELAGADFFVAIGTSGQVYPAAGFVHLAKFAGAQTVEINNAQTAVSDSFHQHRIGPATVEVTRWAAELLASLADHG